MRVISWNVNSVNARRERLLNYLSTTKPDVICLQELKCEEHKFPKADVEALGYHAILLGQKTYNGVAILSREAPSDMHAGLSVTGYPSDARLIAATISGIRVICVYVPNGQDIGSEKYTYKLAWMQTLTEYLRGEMAKHQKLILCGDFNITFDDRDVHDPKLWRDQILCSLRERESLANISKLGLSDSYRRIHQDKIEFSWWDYRQLSFQTGKGLRIDFLLVSEAVAPLLSESWIDRDERKGEKPSDHAPVGLSLRM